MKTLMIGAVMVSAFASFGGSAMAAPADTATNVEVTVRAECRKDSGRGCTAHRVATIKAPDGMYLIPGSLTAGEVTGTNNRGGYRPLCGPAKATGTVPYQLPGTDIIAYLYTSAEAPLHVESGGGLGGLGQVYYVKCKYTFRTKTIPQ